jgi:4-hydroxybenzoate polyprenyltransferase
LLGLAVTFWVSGFDILYACQDYDFDTKAGLHSIPARFGIRRSLKIAALLHLLMIQMLVGVGLSMPLGWIYFGGVLAVASLLVYEHSLVKPEDLSKVNVAFFQMNILISIGLLCVTLADILIL